MAPVAVIQGSSLKGKVLETKRDFSAPLVAGWVVYLFPERPQEDTIAFHLAKVRNTEEAWADFWKRFPGSARARAKKLPRG